MQSTPSVLPRDKEGGVWYYGTLHDSYDLGSKERFWKVVERGKTSNNTYVCPNNRNPRADKGGCNISSTLTEGASVRFKFYHQRPYHIYVVERCEKGATGAGGDMTTRSR